MSGETYDAIVIGGGVTGAGVARDCAMRGLKTLLFERARAGEGTTASSTHLIHGGLRYLLYDRLTTHTTCWDSGHIVRIARPLLTRLPICWPVYRGHTHGLETVETLLEVYDGFTRMKEGKSHLRLSAEETLALIPGLKAEGLLGSLLFDEWWVDPVGLVRANLKSAERYGATVREGDKVAALLKENGRVTGVRTDKGETFSAKVVINAAGPWVDQVAELAEQRVPLRLQKGTHLVYGKRLVPVGLLVEAVDKGRYVFLVPFQDGTLVGPTDLPAPDNPDEVRTSGDEIKYLLDSAKIYFKDFPEKYDSTIVGARPILRQAGQEKLLSREYEVVDHSRFGVEGLVTIAGGKMSDFRIMGEAATTLACAKLGKDLECRTYLETLAGQPIREEDIPVYPRPWRPLKKFLRSHPRLRELHALGYLGAAFARHLLKRGTGARLATARAVREHFS
jgi:glycerol-3-phosphate dehydrogenase